MLSDLDKVAITTARSVVVLSDTQMQPDKADAEVLQVILNLSNCDLAGRVLRASTRPFFLTASV